MSSGYLNLPIELIIRIYFFLEPEEIITAAQVCQRNWYASLERSTWARAVENICYDLRTFIPSFSTENLPLPDLKCIATRHRRFLRRLWDELDYSCALSPRHIQILDVPGRVQRFNLIPGGRYLLTTQSDTNIIQLWDLGVAKQPLKATPLAAMHVDQLLADWQVFMMPTEEGSGLRILPVAWDNGVYTYFNYEIYPTSQSPEFRLLNKLVVASSANPDFSDTAWATHNHFVVWDDENMMIVWNLVEDTWVKWRLPEDTLNISDIYLQDGHILVVNQPNISTYRLTDMKPRTSEDSRDLAYTTPSTPLRVQLDVPANRFSTGCISYQQNWENGLSSHIEAVRPLNRDLRMTRYFFGHDNEDSRPMPRIVCSFNIKDAPVDQNSNCGAAGILLDNNRGLTWTTTNGLYFSLSELNPQDPNNVRQVCGLLFDDWPNALDTDHAYCPMSGRLCLYARLQHQGHRLPCVEGSNLPWKALKAQL